MCAGCAEAFQGLAPRLPLTRQSKPDIGWGRLSALLPAEGSVAFCRRFSGDAGTGTRCVSGSGEQRGMGNHGPPDIETTFRSGDLFSRRCIFFFAVRSVVLQLVRRWDEAITIDIIAARFPEIAGQVSETLPVIICRRSLHKPGSKGHHSRNRK